MVRNASPNQSLSAAMEKGFNSSNSRQQDVAGIESTNTNQQGLKGQEKDGSNAQSSSKTYSRADVADKTPRFAEGSSKFDLADDEATNKAAGQNTLRFAEGSEKINFEDDGKASSKVDSPQSYLGSTDGLATGAVNSTLVATLEAVRYDLLRKLNLSSEQSRHLKHVNEALAYTRSNSTSSSALKRKTGRFEQATSQNAERYTKPFCDFMTANPTVFHAVDATKKQLKLNGWKELSERDGWDIERGGKYFVDRNGSSLIAFVVGEKYESGNGAAIIAGHVDALTAKLKPISGVPNKAGFVQLGVAPYAGGLNSTWWDRDLGIGGRVLVKENDKIVSKLVKLNYPIARIPTLAPHFGAAANGPFNPETQMTPIIGLDATQTSGNDDKVPRPFSQPSLISGTGGSAASFTSTQPPRLVRAIEKELGIASSESASIVNWELELFDVQPATVGGIDKEFIFAGRIDDKMCSWAAIQALIDSDVEDSSILKIVGLFDDEEIGSLLRQGARSNFLPQIIERATGALADHKPASDLFGRTYANSFLLSADVIHAVNPNFLNAYLENHAPHLNTGLVVSADSNGHMTTDAVSTAILKRCADKVGAKLQVFQIRNDSRSGGTVGPMLSSATGVRSVDAGIPQLSMHSIRATTGNLDPGLGVITFGAFLNGFEEVDKEFRE